MKILITGGGGFLGTALTQFLTGKGHVIYALSRKKSAGRIIHWNPDQGRIATQALEGFDVVIHLAGENLAGWWTAAKKQRIYASRIAATRLLSEALLSLNRPPGTFVSASAVGFYGDRGEEVLTESSAVGRGFLPRLCHDWEEAAQSARRDRLRTAHMRLGLILAADGGILGNMLPLFRAGLGGRLGNGRQVMSWVHRQDVCRAVEFILSHEAVSGPVNVTSPQPVSNRHFTKSLARALRRPAIFSAPAWALRLLMGQMAEEMLLSSARVMPQRLLQEGFQFAHPEIETALQHLFARS